MKVYVTMSEYVEDFVEGRNLTYLDTVWTNINTARDRIKQMAEEEAIRYVNEDGTIEYDGIESKNPNEIIVYDTKDVYTKYYIVERELEDH